MDLFRAEGWLKSLAISINMLNVKIF